MGKVILAILLCLSTGCLDHPVGIGTLRGTWTLETVNGNALPYTMSGSGANKTELMSDVLNLHEGFTYDETIQVRSTVDGQVTTTSTTKPGPYFISLGSVVFASNDGTPNKTALVEGNKMTFTEPGIVRVFSK